MKQVSKSQITGQRGELLVADRTLAMGFIFDERNRLETGIDGTIELRDPVTEQTLAQWIGAQVKTTDSDRYSYEDDAGFEYLLKPDDLAYWRGANIPVIIILVRLSDASMYWKPVDAGQLTEPRRLRFDKAADRYEKSAADRIAALCIDKNRLGSHVPPMLTGEPVHLTMVRIILPERIFVGASLFGSRREAAKELAQADPRAPFDWVVRDRRFISFRDPEGTALTEIVDEGSVEAVETEAVSLSDDTDEENAFIDLLRRTLSVQLDDRLSYDREARALYFQAPGHNRPLKISYQSLVKGTSAEVVTLWRGKDGRVGSVRHHAFVPRFQRIGDDWYLSVTPTFVFTRDGHRPHPDAGALIAGKKKKEKNGAIRGQFIMWRDVLMKSGQASDGLFGASGRYAPLRFEALPPVLMPRAVPEAAWRTEDPNAADMADTEELF